MTFFFFFTWKGTLTGCVGEGREHRTTKFGRKVNWDSSYSCFNFFVSLKLYFFQYYNNIIAFPPTLIFAYFRINKANTTVYPSLLIIPLISRGRPGTKSRQGDHNSSSLNDWRNTQPSQKKSGQVHITGQILDN